MRQTARARSRRGVDDQPGPPTRQRVSDGDLVERGEAGGEVVRPLPDVAPVDVRDVQQRGPGGHGAALAFSPRWRRSARSARRCVPRRGRRRRATLRLAIARYCADRRAASRFRERFDRRSVPTSRATPNAIASGRSVSSRITSTGLPSAGASSWMPPESVRITVAWSSRVTNGPYERGSTMRTAARARRSRRRSRAALPGWGAPDRRSRCRGSAAAMAFSARSMPRIGAPKFSRRCDSDDHQPAPGGRGRCRGECGGREPSAARRSPCCRSPRWPRPGSMRSREQVLRGTRTWARNAARRSGGDLPVHLLGERVAEVAGPQARLDVKERQVLVERDQRRGEHGRRVPLRDTARRREVGERPSPAPARSGRRSRRGAGPGCIRSRATSGTQAEQRHGLGQQLAVLAGIDQHRREGPRGAECGDDRRHLHDLGARADDAGYAAARRVDAVVRGIGGHAANCPTMAKARTLPGLRLGAAANPAARAVRSGKTRRCGCAVRRRPGSCRPGSGPRPSPAPAPSAGRSGTSRRPPDRPGR